jgi:hypothetical protein
VHLLRLPRVARAPYRAVYLESFSEQRQVTGRGEAAQRAQLERFGSFLLGEISVDQHTRQRWHVCMQRASLCDCVKRVFCQSQDVSNL